MSHISAYQRGKRFGGVMTPYHWKMKEARGWRIGFGASSFLVASGSGFSIKEGRRLFRRLESEWMDRVKARRPGKRKK